MKRYDPSRADKRNIVEKAFGLIYAMNDEEAESLVERLKDMARKDSTRAKFILSTKIKD